MADPASRSPSPAKRPRCDADTWDDFQYGPWPSSPLKLPPSPAERLLCDDDEDARENDDRSTYDPCPLPPLSYRRSPPDERAVERCKAERRGYPELAVRRHNKNKGNKVKYSLVEAVGMGVFFEGGGCGCCQTQVHLNLRVRAKNGPKKHRPDELVYAELRALGNRTRPRALTSWQLLDGKNQIGGCVWLEEQKTWNVMVPFLSQE